MKMGNKDYISDMPDSVIDCILTKLPIIEAVKTSILSTKWRYQWATMSQLVFHEFQMCWPLTEQQFGNFIMRFLFLHHGPIHKFQLDTYYKKSIDIDQWLLFLSRKDIKELVLQLHIRYQRIPSCIFDCQKLTRLTLQGFGVKPPLRFHGFPCLKYLNLSGGPFTLEVIENLISGSPLLEKFILRNEAGPLGLAIHAPNLKHLTLYGVFTNLYLEHTPLLEVLSIDFIEQAWEGNFLMKVPVTYDRLKFVGLQRINFELINRVLYVLHLILQSPNLQQLEIDAIKIKYSHDKAADLDIWEKECPTDFIFKHLKSVEMSGVSNKSCVEFLKFVLGRSPVLEVMRVSPDEDYHGKMNMADEVLHFRRASPKVDIRFFDKFI